MSDFILPPPADHQKLERIVCDALEVHWKLRDTLGKLNFEGPGYGPQGGIDLFGCDNKGRKIVVQVKKREDDLSISDIRTDLMKFKSSLSINPDLSGVDCFYIATTAKRERKLQHQVNELKKEFLLDIDFFYWDEICGYLHEEPRLLAKHFPWYCVPRLVTGTQAVESALPAFQAGYLLRSIVSEFRYIYDPDRADISLPLMALQTALRRLLSHEASEEICLEIRQIWERTKRRRDVLDVEKNILQYKRCVAKWQTSRIEECFDFNLVGRRSFDLGSVLGHFSSYYDASPDEVVSRTQLCVPAYIVDMVQHLLPTLRRREILSWVDGYINDDLLYSLSANMDFGECIYHNIERKLLWLDDKPLRPLE